MGGAGEDGREGPAPECGDLREALAADVFQNAGTRCFRRAEEECRERFKAGQAVFGVEAGAERFRKVLEARACRLGGAGVHGQSLVHARFGSRAEKPAEESAAKTAQW